VAFHFTPATAPSGTRNTQGLDETGFFITTTVVPYTYSMVW
jgi:hypothetical protein